MAIKRVIASFMIMLAVAGSAALNVTPAQGVGCWGDYCSGMDPQSTGCSADAITLASDESYATGASVELRWSPTCKTEWARVPQNNWDPGDSLGIVQDTGYRQGYSGENANFAWSKMIYSPVKKCSAWWDDHNWDWAQTIYV